MHRCYYFLITALLLTNTVYSQNAGAPVEVTPEISSKIQQQIAKEEVSLTAELKKKKSSDATIEFELDKFRVDAYMQQYMKYDYSTAGMRSATYHAAEQYDSLLNKYYKMLIAALNQADRPKLVAAQRAWLSYRDSELHLIEVLSKEQYSGGGTIQQLVEADNYLVIIKNRTETIFDYYERATTNQ